MSVSSVAIREREPGQQRQFTISERPTVQGKFLVAGGEKFYVKGVTYGTFQPSERDDQFPARERVERDFKAMIAAGINTVRVYTAPPRWLLDLAAQNGLYLLVGLPWEQHITFLRDRSLAREIRSRVRSQVRSSQGHPAVLAYAIGNEIPASIVRWHGPEAVQSFLRGLYDTVKTEDPSALVTYVNFPTTEYLELPFLDFFAYNVYLEERDRLEAYLARLQNLAGDRPLLMAEIGLDSRRNGEDRQAETLSWQIESCFASGLAGLFLYAWTDEWWRGGTEVEDWDFGLTTRDRQPKPALEAVRDSFAKVPFPDDREWPRISVIVCTHNGERTLEETLFRLLELDYPDFEVIVVDDGSSDSSREIASQFPVRLISIPNGGLSNARNTGAREATGQYLAYLDDDAYPDPHWLQYLAHTFLTTEFTAVGGPNIPPPGDGLIAECVANSPGGPLHVLLDDSEAEHIPGCNMAFHRKRFLELGGFDPQFRTAGDDVDFCWRWMERGWKVGFNPGAVVWHHRRNSLKNFWKQQKGYGRAEALLERKWPSRYTPLGHITWEGRIYSEGVLSALGRGRSRIYFGSRGQAPFQGIYQSPPGLIASLPQTPEWFLLNGMLLTLGLLGFLWPPLFAFLGLLLILASLPLIRVIRLVSGLSFPSSRYRPLRLFWMRGLTAVMHIAQPMARLWGRLKHGLTPWRRRGERHRWSPAHQSELWSEEWKSPDQWLDEIEKRLKETGAVVRSGGDFDAWDLELRGGLLGRARGLLAIEEHGEGRQMVRFRVWLCWRRIVSAVVGIPAALAAAAWVAGASQVALILLLLTLLVGFWGLREALTACGLFRLILARMGQSSAV